MQKTLSPPEQQLHHLAQLAYQGGDKALQRGWWGHVQHEAEQAGITKADLLAAIEALKEQPQ